SVLDVYQATTQMTDESGQSFPFNCDTLLDRALGPEGYYGAFVCNMHTDSDFSAGSYAIVSSALSPGVPIFSSRQLLTWLDAGNASKINSIVWSNNTQRFSIVTNSAARGLQVMAPVPGGYGVTSVKFNGNPVAYQMRIIKGIQYAFITASTGNYE